MTTADDVRGAFAAQTHAMVLADLAALDELLSDGFTLTHMTGTVQSKAAWRLQLRLDYERHDGAWIARRSVASTW
jgi:hypothetical protein